jgi:hypothetical protein
MYNFSTFYWDKQQEELQIKWKKERDEKEKLRINKN